MKRPTKCFRFALRYHGDATVQAPHLTTCCGFSCVVADLVWWKSKVYLWEEGGGLQFEFLVELPEGGLLFEGDHYFGRGLVFRGQVVRSQFLLCLDFTLPLFHAVGTPSADQVPAPAPAPVQPTESAGANVPVFDPSPQVCAPFLRNTMQ